MVENPKRFHKTVRVWEGVGKKGNLLHYFLSVFLLADIGAWTLQ